MMLRLCLLFMIFLSAHAADKPLHIDMYADREQAEIGDEIVITVTYSWPSTYQVTPEPNPADVFNQEDLFIVNAPPVERLSTGGREQRRWTLHVLAQFSGAWAIPRPGFQASDPDDRIVTASAPEVILQIGSSDNPPRLAEPSLAWTYADSKDAGVHSNTWWYVLVLLLIITVIAVFLYRKKPIEEIIDPYERFNQELKQAQQQQNYKDAAALLSKAIRSYCSQIWVFDGLGATNKEIRYHLQRHLKADDLRKVCGILDSIEDIRWAPDHENAQVIQRCLVDAHSWCQDQERERQAKLAAEQTQGVAQS